jgi:hypothetical protein
MVGGSRKYFKKGLKDARAIDNFVGYYLHELTGFGSAEGCQLLYDDSQASDPTCELLEFAKVGVEFMKRQMGMILKN